MLMQRPIYLVSDRALLYQRSGLDHLPTRKKCSWLNRLICGKNLCQDSQLGFSDERNSFGLQYARYTARIADRKLPFSETYLLLSQLNPCLAKVLFGIEPPQIETLTLLNGESAYLAARDKDMLAAPDKRQKIVVYVHGFNTNPLGACQHGAVVDAAFDGNPEYSTDVFDWASRGGFDKLTYFCDLQSAHCAVPRMEQHLLLLALMYGPENVTVVAHSMGGEIVCRALTNIANKLGTSTPQFAQVILVAPDVDRAEWCAVYAEGVGACTKQIRVLVSSKDRALKASQLLWGKLCGCRNPIKHLRLGQPDNPPQTKNTEVIDDSILDANDGIGHEVRARFVAFLAKNPDLSQARQYLSVNKKGVLVVREKRRDW